MMSELNYFTVINGLEAEGWEWEEEDDRRTFEGGAVAKRFSKEDENVSFVIECEDDWNAFFDFDDNEDHPALADLIARYRIVDFSTFLTDESGTLIEAEGLSIVSIPDHIKPEDRLAYISGLAPNRFGDV